VRPENDVRDRSSQPRTERLAPARAGGPLESPAQGHPRREVDTSGVIGPKWPLGVPIRRVLAAITEAGVARQILACLNLPTRAPPLARSRPAGRAPAWPAHEAPDTAATDASWTAFEFDQSTPAEWDVGA